MKAINVIKSVAVAAMVCVSVAASADSKTKVYMNSYLRPSMAVVSVVPGTESEVYKMEVTDAEGSMVYLTKRMSDVDANQFLLDIRNLKDGDYKMTFYSKDGSTVSHAFRVDGKKVVR